MLSFPNCKINIGLNITGKRADGYHNIETVFYPVRWNDALEIIHSAVSQNSSDLIFTQSGVIVDGEQKDNLCIKAFQLLKKDFPHLPIIKIHLHKAIPMGAGLGGGSADAAFTLKALNEKFSLNLSTDQLLAYALQLGSDCPFFILNTPCFASGRGEILEPVKMDLTGYQLVLANPGIHVNTKWAFSQLAINYFDRPASEIPIHSIAQIISQPVSNWKEWLINDFERPVFEKYPAIKAIKQAFYEKGALYASMSGSGSSVYGIFDKNPNSSFNFPGNYLLRTVIL
jgi:4-diphosphocytidyl-2-C-methyl-D-erythritol kinase